MFTVKSRNGWSKTVKADSADDAAALAWPDRAVIVRPEDNTVRDFYTPRRVLGTVIGEPEPAREPVCLFGRDSAGRPDGTVHHDDICPDSPGQVTDVVTGRVLRTRR